MSSFLQSVDERTKLAGTNKLEMLMFSLGKNKETGKEDIYGINVFKLWKMMKTPEITRVPGSSEEIEGMVSVLGQLMPVINLNAYLGNKSECSNNLMMIVEYNNHVHAFLIDSFIDMLSVDWNEVKVPPEMLSNGNSIVTGVASYNEDLVMILDVEKILSDMMGYQETLEPLFIKLEEEHDKQLEEKRIFFVDDSLVARKQIAKTLEVLKITYDSAINGKEAWEKLDKIAQEATAKGIPVKKVINAILTDVEMPEMDGYMLTKAIKSDARFAGIPVLMHSSLSGVSNRKLGESVGVDNYVTKFEPQKLAESITQIMCH